MGWRADGIGNVSFAHDIVDAALVMKVIFQNENIAHLIFEIARQKGLPVTAVTLWETPNSYATYSKK